MDVDQETQDHRAHLATLLEQHRANLADLELQASRYGLTPPLEISNGIRYEKEQIRLYTDALDSPLPAPALERLGPAGRAQITVKRIDRLEAQLGAREAFDQIAREQRQREVDARDQARDRLIRGVFWGIAILCFFALLGNALLIVIAQLLFALLARG